MNRPLTVWLLFTLCLLVALAAMIWMSGTLLELDRLRRQAQVRAAREETVRLALWRMDSRLAPLIAGESARPAWMYRPFVAADRIYPNLPVKDTGAPLLPSPLLHRPERYIRLHFQLARDGTLTSPQAPEERWRALAARDHLDADALARAEALLRQERETILLAAAEAAPHRRADGQAYWSGRLPIRSAVSEETPADETRQTDTTKKYVRAEELLSDEMWQAREPKQIMTPDEVYPLPDRQTANQPMAQAEQRQEKYNRREFASRAQVLRRNFEDIKTSNDIGQMPPRVVKNKMPVKRSRPDETPAAPSTEAPATAPEPEAMQARWIGNRLVLLRTFATDDPITCQGCLLDWPGIETMLLEEIRDLLPQARLEPTRNGRRGDRSRLLAGLPLRLVPGAEPEAPAYVSPIGITLALAWSGVIVAALAIAALLRGALDLSERRGAFVSAVTHEMRTPLTTFRMYSEMLAGGMVPQTKRKRYLQTLTTEANRLAHLVENVLSYARLERGRARGRIETLGLSETLARACERLHERARSAGFTLAIDETEAARRCRLRVDATAVEQILFNLVDNACKYAATAEEKRIELRATVENGRGVIRLRDFGPGIEPREKARIFRPFRKSARDAANSAPGVGLGLALSRRLARAMGGDLQYEPGRGGACFRLVLPATRGR